MKSDIFSLGLTFHFILTEGRYLHGEDEQEQYLGIVTRLDPAFNHLLPTYDSKCSLLI